jgi:hypothetical protein
MGPAGDRKQWSRGNAAQRFERLRQSAPWEFRLFWLAPHSGAAVLVTRTFERANGNDKKWGDLCVAPFYRTNGAARGCLRHETDTNGPGIFRFNRIRRSRFIGFSFAK